MADICFLPHQEMTSFALDEERWTEAQIFEKFISYIASKEDEECFNVPYGTIEILPVGRQEKAAYTSKHSQ